MRRVLGLLVLLAAAGCAGRWMSVDQPIRPLPTPPPRDYRVVLRNDSILILHDAVLRNDSLVELPRQPNDSGVQPSCGVDMLDVVRVEVWQSRGERMTGTIVLGTLAVLAASAWWIFHSLSGPGS
ncbi:MAG TPA: hypothetical protein VEU73_12150 [Gemmatimonadales bacterium]|nr:hypothetical protein [Gemmatimonadales bacterium]